MSQRNGHTVGIKGSGRVRRGLAELAIIVVGILLAFQVEEWREERKAQRDVQAALERLLDETRENLAMCARLEPILDDNIGAVLHVFRSLQAGDLIDGDRRRFEQGMIMVDVVPDIHLHTSVAREMLATGLLKEVSSPALRGAIARLPTLEEQTRALLTYWRTPVIELSSELTELVEFGYSETAFETSRQSGWQDILEHEMTVTYDFQELAANRRLRNLFFEAVDVHSDNLSALRERCGVATETHQGLLEVLGPEYANQTSGTAPG